MCPQKRTIPIKEGLWIALPSEEIRLLGKRCLSCGEVFPPGRARNFCIRCQQKKLEEIELCPLGRVVSFTVAMQPPAGGFYHGPVPYCYGLVELDDGVRILAGLGRSVEQLGIGMRVKLVIETLYEDQGGNNIQVFRFRPVGQRPAD